MDGTKYLSAKRKNENLRRKRMTLFRKAHELGKSDGVEVAAFVFQNGRFFTYRSLEKES